MAIVVILLVSFFALGLFQFGSLLTGLALKNQPCLLLLELLIMLFGKVSPSNAWAYFQPGIGVDSKTGLPYAGASDFKGFTDWDLGVYIQSVIDAQKIGLIGTDGDWGSNQRLEKAMHFS